MNFRQQGEYTNICRTKNFNKIISLIDKGVDVNFIFLRMCEFGNLKVIKYFLAKGYNITYNNNYPVRLACENGHLEVVTYLVEECKSNPRSKDDWALCFAIVNGHLGVVKYLVEKCGGRLGMEDSYWTIRDASINGYFEVIKYLVEKCGATLQYENERYDRYITIYEKGQVRRRHLASKKIYFWWVQACYNPDTLCGHRSIQKGYKEYINYF